MRHYLIVLFLAIVLAGCFHENSGSECENGVDASGICAVGTNSNWNNNNWNQFKWE